MFLNLVSVPTRELDHIPGEPHGYSLRSLTPAYWPSVDFSDVAALSNSNQTGNKILSRFLPVKLTSSNLKFQDSKIKM